MPVDERASPSLLARRLLIITGKGGTGKTTVATALALLAARRGLETVIVETSKTAQCPRLLGVAGESPARDPLRVAPHLSVLKIDPLEALTEYLELQLPVKAVVSRLTHMTGFRRLLEAAPGWRELITLGKLWHLESQRTEHEPRWDLLVVDGPATGHGLSFLSVPGVVLDTVRLGPLRRHTEAVQALLQDPHRTLVVPVTLPEELPVSETLELRVRVRELGLGLGPTIANGIERGPAIEGPAVLGALSALPAAATAPLPAPEVLGEIVQEALTRAALQTGFLKQLRDTAGEVVELPLLPTGVRDRSHIEKLATELDRALESA